MYSYWGDRTETGLHVPSAVMICPPELPINDEARNEAQVCDIISTKNESGNYWYIIKSAKSSTLK